MMVLLRRVETPAVKIRVVAALVLLAWAPLRCASAQSAQERVQWNRPVEPFRIIGNIHYVGAAGVSAFLITTPDGAFLLDGGLPETAPLIRASIEALGFRIADVKYLLNSHAHFDHAGGLDALKSASGAAMVASAGDAPALHAGGPDMPAVTVDRIVDDGASLELGGTTMVANVTPGHTKGCTSWSTTVTEAGRQYRVLFNCSVSVVDRLVGNASYPGIVADYEGTFRRLRGFEADVFLSSHPYAFDMDAKRGRIRAGGPNPFVDPAEAGRFMEQAERQFRAELKKQQ
jgi:metallo-beta-lactamase class B